MTSLLQNYLSAQAAKRPGSIAVNMVNASLSYQQVDQASNQLARLLIQAGCQRGDRVCLLLPKCPAAIVAMHAVLKADCVYVPMDLSCPAARTIRIVESAEPRVILADRSAIALLDSLYASTSIHPSTVLISMDRDQLIGQNFRSHVCLDELDSRDAGPLEYANTPADAAQILFTSGSTGTPKGVVITHANVVHFVDWARKFFEIRPDDRISGHPPLHFDLSTFDIYGAFASGARLELVPPSLNMLPTKVAQFIRDAELNQWFSVPSLLTLMAKFDVVAPNDFPHLQRVLWCGEVLPTPTLIYWMQRLPHVRFTNLYGPTEATIASSFHTVETCPRDPQQEIPIGTACDGESLLVLDDALQPVSVGTIGDLYIGGVGLSPGYWRDTKKTAVAFLRQPNTQQSPGRIYKTGDLARCDDDGLFYFLGRSDSQIKSRGYRIELGEVESAFNTLDVLDDCAIVSVPSSGFEGTAICCAYVCHNGTKLTPAALRERASDLLPGYMLPSRWKALTELPKNGNGKTDRPLLKEIFQTDSTA